MNCLRSAPTKGVSSAPSVSRTPLTRGDSATDADSEGVEGKYFVFTSFNTPATPDPMGNPGGLNGDLKTGGQIVIADADSSGVQDNARTLVPRAGGDELPVT